MPSYAQIIVDVSAQALDRLFTYRVPDNLTVSPGQRVLAPFGPRKLEGFVISLSDEADLPDDKVKSLVGVLEDFPVILPELIELAHWMSEKYHCALVESLRLMIPAQMRGGRVKPKTVRIAQLAVSGEALEQVKADSARAPKRLEMIEALERGPAPASALGSASALQALVKAGVVEFVEEDVMRAPYAGIPAQHTPDPPLMDQQREALDMLTPALQSGGGRYLLHGVTGSGKTEVYMRIIRETLTAGRGAIVLVPEIALTPQMVDWFRARFAGEAAVIHSRLSVGERYDEWRRIRAGAARVVIGARSAVFAPVQNLGVIVVDEEHESTYQSERHPRYDAREIAQWRTDRASALLILGSATPSITSYMKAMQGVRPENKFHLIEMHARVMGRSLPDVTVVDMRQEITRGNRTIFSLELAAALKTCLGAGKQAILFINRRGHSTFVSCRACGYVEKCEQCDVSLTYHQSGEMMRCHYCGAEHKAPAVCPACGSKFIKFFGTGTQKVERAVKDLLPGARVVRMDMDTTAGKDAHEHILSAFRRGEFDVLVGTQMITKGLDFPNVTLVGVVAADLSLNVPDYRSVERTFQLITQVAGRAGRADFPGRVVVQSYDPDHYGIQFAAKQDFRAFYLREVQARRRGLNPPYTAIARLLITADDDPMARQIAEILEERLGAFLDGGYRDYVVQMRALEAPLKRIRGESRWQVFLKFYAKGPVDEVINFMDRLREEVEGDARVDLEVNPVSLL